MIPRASFVIPVHNGAAYLADCLESCLAQTQKRFEVIVVNDGSTDSTQHLIDYYTKKDKRIVSVKLETNQGRSMARNVGIEKANSDVILTLDADDLATPNRVGDTLNFFKANPRIDIAYGEFAIVNPHGIIIGHQKAIPYDWEKIKTEKFFFIGHSTMAFNKKVFKKVQYSDGEWSSLGIDDWKFQLDAQKAGFKFGAINKLLCRYRYIPKERDEKRVTELKEESLGLLVVA